MLFRSGSGNDVLTGGAGSDHFVFNTSLNSSPNVDTVTDFQSGIDKIDLAKSIMAALGNTGTLTADQFKSGTGSGAAVTGLDSTDRIVYNTTTGALYYDADGSGQGAAVQFALIGVSSHPALANTDFLIV